MKCALTALAVAFFVAPISFAADSMATITPASLQSRLKSEEKPLIVDVREIEEFDAGHIDGAFLAPLATVTEKLSNVAKDREIVLVCRSGRRSAKAYSELAKRGYTRLFNLEGGMLSWEKSGYRVVKE